MAFTRIALALAEGGHFELYGDGAQSRSFTYVADVVAATTLATRGDTRRLQRRRRRGSDDAGGARAARRRSRAARLQVTYGPTQTGDMQRTKADTGRIERELGWRAATPLHDGLSRHWQWAERARLRTPMSAAHR